MRFLFLFFLGFQSLTFAQNMCDVYKMMFLDGKNKFSNFYGPNDGELGDTSTFVNLNVDFLKSVRKDVLNGQNFVDGLIYSIPLAEIYENVEFKENLWHFQLQGPDIDLSSIPESERLTYIENQLTKIATDIQTSCFPSLYLDNLSKGNSDSEYICSINICAKKPEEDEIIQAYMLPSIPHFNLSIRKSKMKEHFYYINYLVSYPVM